jgi:hypothetical protein
LHRSRWCEVNLFRKEIMLCESLTPHRCSDPDWAYSQQGWQTCKLPFFQSNICHFVRPIPK